MLEQESYRHQGDTFPDLTLFMQLGASPRGLDKAPDKLLFFFLKMGGDGVSP